jgi:hypothetical protein
MGYVGLSIDMQMMIKILVHGIRRACFCVTQE